MKIGRSELQTNGAMTMKHAHVYRALLVAVLATAPAAFAGTPGDVEPNQVVDLRDLVNIRNAQGQSGSPGFIGADVDVNGTVDRGDIWLWRQNFPSVGSPAGLTTKFPSALSWPAVPGGGNEYEDVPIGQDHDCMRHRWTGLHGPGRGCGPAHHIPRATEIRRPTDQRHGRFQSEIVERAGRRRTRGGVRSR